MTDAQPSPETSHAPPRTLRLRIRLGLAWVTALYLAFLFLLSVGMHWGAEKNIALVFFSFLPSHLWIIPLVLLLPLTLPFSLRLALIQLLALAAFFFLYMDYQVVGMAPTVTGSDEKKSRLTILSNNRGQAFRTRLDPFKDSLQPDIVLLQEAFGRAALYQKDKRYAEFPHVIGEGQFLILSKFPVLDQRSINFPASEGDNVIVAARFEIDFDGTPIAVYSVHLPTLRDVLGHYRRGPFLLGIVGVPGTPWGNQRATLQQFWDHRVDLARKLNAAIKAEIIPCLVAGDFNMPDHGVIYHNFTRHLTDAHETAGQAFGSTFPGNSDSALAFHKPWLRLDYIFSNHSWNTLSFTTEKDRPSQHRAIAATLELTPHSP